MSRASSGMAVARICYHVAMTLDGKNLPSALSQPPRRVEGRGRVARGLLKGLSLLVVLAALACLAYLAVTVAWYFSGVEVKGEIYGTHTETGRRSNTDYLDFTYQAGGKNFDDKQSVSHEIYEAVGKKIIPNRVEAAVRYYHAGPVRIATLPEYSANGWELAKVGFFAGVVTAIALAVFWSAWIDGARERRLLRLGRATLGAVTGKRTEQRRFKTFLIEYVYDAPSGHKYKSEMMTSRANWDAAQIGDVVTVLVDPADEKKSLAYEYGVLRVVSI